MVLARDLDLARFEVLHGVVTAAMSEFHLEGALPPLRERGDDITLLFRKFASDFAEVRIYITDIIYANLILIVKVSVIKSL